MTQSDKHLSVAPHAAPRPTLAVVTGRPCSGKSTLARLLADALSCSLVSRDEMYNGILRTARHASGSGGKEQVSRSAFAAFFRTIGLLLSCDVSFVTEAAFQNHRWRLGLDPLVAEVNIRIIHSVIDPDLAYQRVIRRHLARKEARQLAGAPDQFHAFPLASFVTRPFEPLSLPVPSLCVRTTDGYDPGLDAILTFVCPRHPTLATASSD